VSKPFASYNDPEAGDVYGGSELHDQCEAGPGVAGPGIRWPWSSLALEFASKVRLGLHRATNQAEPAGVSRQFKFAYPSGTLAVWCAGCEKSATTPCQGVWLHLLFLGVTYTSSNGARSCFGVSPNV